MAYEIIFISDSTGEYVRGEIGTLKGSIYSSGLPSVTILIGFYDRLTGEIIGGVVNHPFAVYDEENQRYVAFISKEFLDRSQVFLVYSKHLSWAQPVSNLHLLDIWKAIHT